MKKLFPLAVLASMLVVAGCQDTKKVTELRAQVDRLTQQATDLTGKVTRLTAERDSLAKIVTGLKAKGGKTALPPAGS